MDYHSLSLLFSFRSHQAGTLGVLTQLQTLRTLRRMSTLRFHNLIVKPSFFYDCNNHWADLTTEYCSASSWFLLLYALLLDMPRWHKFSQIVKGTEVCLRTRGNSLSIKEGQNKLVTRLHPDTVSSHRGTPIPFSVTKAVRSPLPPKRVQSPEFDSVTTGVRGLQALHTASPSQSTARISHPTRGALHL